MATILDTLDDEQRAAATAPDGYVMVRAGAGTGKTRTLVARIAYLIQDRGVRPSEICTVTFTNKAAREIRERVAAHISEDAAAGLVMGTFHSLGARILRRHHEAAGLPRDFGILDDEDSLPLAQEAVYASGVLARPVPGSEGHAEAERDAKVYARTLHDQIKQWKSWGATAAMLEKEDLRDQLPQMALAYRFYEAELARRGKVDFGDLVLRSWLLLHEVEPVRDFESSRVKHLLVDEAQDANPAQLEWVRVLRGWHNNSFVVGDEDQSIFSFQGGSGRVMDMLVKVPDDRRGAIAAVEYRLTTNRRCTDQILAPAVTLVGWNRRSSPKVLRSGVDGPAPRVSVFGNEREEANAVVAAVHELVSCGTDPDEIAVLVRSNWVVAPLEEAFVRAEIPYEVVGGTLLANREEVKTLAGYLRLAADPYDDTAFRYVLNRPTRGLGPAAERVLLARWDDSGEPFHEICRRVDTVDGLRVAGSTRENLDRLGAVLHSLSLSHSLHERPTHELLSMVLEDDGVGYERHLLAEKDKRVLRRRQEMVEVVTRLAFEVPDLVEFLARLALATDLDAARRSRRVRISTMHSAKGLEWDHVFCPCFDADVTPSPRAVQSGVQGTFLSITDGLIDGGVQEERRLAHVAFTRARKTLWVSAPLSRTRTGPCAPSVFMSEAGLERALARDPFDDRPAFSKVGSKKSPRAGRKGFARR